MRFFICLGLILVAQAAGQGPAPSPKPARPVVAEAPEPPEPPEPARAPFFYFNKPGRWNSEVEDRVYESGRKAIDSYKWEDALRSFTQIANQGGNRADAALYWKAYVESRMGRRDDSLATLEQLKTQHAKSRWLNDAKALEMEVRRATGASVRPEAQQDDDLKLLAMSGLMNSNPEKAFPLIVKMLDVSNSPKLRERALFVIAHSGSPKAREVILNFARGAANPEMQRRSLEYLGMMGGLPELEQLYPTLTDAGLKRGVMRGLAAAEASDPLVRLVKNEKDPNLRREAIRYLASTDYDVSQLYSAETDVGVRTEIIRHMADANRVDQVFEIARNEREIALRREAVRRLGRFENAKATQALITLYGSESDLTVKKEIVRSLGDEDNPKALISLARQEKDPGMRREMVRILANMKSPEVSDFMLEILGQNNQ